MNHLFAIILCFLVTAAPAIAQTLRIDTINIPPYGFTDATGKPTGAWYEIGNRIAEEAGLTYTNTIVPFARAAMEMKNGSADMVIRYGSGDILDYATPVDTVVNLPIILFSNVKDSYSALSAMHGKTVGELRGANVLESLDTQVIRYDNNDYASMLKMVKAGRLDGVIGFAPGFVYTIKSENLSTTAFGKPVKVGEKPVSLFVSKKMAHPGMQAKLQAALQKLKTQGVIQRIFDKYCGVAASGS